MDAAPLVEALARARRTVAVAESFTGGRVLDAITDVPGASAVLAGGVVAYTNEAKERLLGVPRSILVVDGAVSTAAARAMAAGARARFGADYAVATTGIAGPTGATLAKPVGLSIVAAAGLVRIVDERRRHVGDRGAVKESACRQALDVLARLLREEGIL